MMNIHTQKKMNLLVLLSLLLLISCSVAELLETDFLENDDALSGRRLDGRKRKSSGSVAARIVGGTPAGADAYPFIVSLYSLDQPDGTVPICGK
jgi:hypothetical protein